MDQFTRIQCQHSLDLLVGQEKEVAQRFFSLLFTRAPELKFLFPNNIDELSVQVETLVNMALTLAGSDENRHTKLRVAGFRMAMRGLHHDYHEVLANTLLGVVKRQLRQSWQPDFDDAWREVIADALVSLDSGAELMAA